jgi:hypothetical protein
MAIDMNRNIKISPLADSISPSFLIYASGTASSISLSQHSSSVPVTIRFLYHPLATKENIFFNDKSL